jgi:hypothetical protein
MKAIFRVLLKKHSMVAEPFKQITSPHKQVYTQESEEDVEDWLRIGNGCPKMVAYTSPAFPLL